MPKPPPLRLPEQDNTEPIKAKKDDTEPIKPESATEIIEPLDYYVMPPGKRKPKPDRRESALYLPLWSLVLMLLMVFAVAGGLIILVLALGGPKNVSRGEPVIIVLTAAPFETPSAPEISSTLIPNVVVTSQPASSIALSGPTLAPTMTFTPTAITIAVGSEVIVVGAGGVRVRSSPGTDDSVNTVLEVANRGRVFTIVGGPQDANGLKFWKISEPSTNLIGWAAEGDGSQDLLQVFVP